MAMAVHRHNTRVNLNFHECILLVINALISAEPGHGMVCRMVGNCYGTTPSENSENLNSSLGTVYNMYNLRKLEMYSLTSQYLRALNGQQEFFIDLREAASVFKLGPSNRYSCFWSEIFLALTRAGGYLAT